ncbi:MAG TPA: MlaD family protein [Desulfobacteraceae bacterium]|nr:MlaD family protein [Desulfobacteraceae bacterium]
MNRNRSILFCLICTGILLFFGCSSPLDYRIAFNETNGIETGNAVVFEKNRIGKVNKIVYREKGDYLVSVQIEPDFSAVVTGKSRFHIQDSPLNSGEKAIIITLIEKGGEPLKSGSVIQGNSPPSPFVEITPFLETFEKSFNKFVSDLKTFPETEEYKKLESQLDRFVNDIKEKGDTVREKFNNETLPAIKKELEILRKKLEELGREEEIKPLEKKLDNLKEV